MLRLSDKLFFLAHKLLHAYNLSVIMYVFDPTYICYNRQRALRKRNCVAMGFVKKVLWRDHTFVMKCTLNALCLL